MSAQVVLIILVLTTGHSSVTEHQFTSMENCMSARDQVTNVSFRFGSEIRAYCIKKQSK